MKTTTHLMAAVLAGGSGTRLWPLSHAGLPKQHLTLFGKKTLLGSTVDRFRGLVPSKDLLVVTGRDHVSLVRRDARSVPPRNILAEPAMRGTAAAVAWAAAEACRRDPDALLVVVASDAWIDDDRLFRRDIAAAARVVAKNPHHIALLGIRPNRPHAGYGYMECGGELDADENTGVAALTVQRFTEKPDAATAAKFVASGKHFWNSGMFVGYARRLADVIVSHIPDYAPLFSAADPAKRYSRLAPHILDYDVWEKETRLLAHPASFLWDDVGTWQAVSELAGSSGNSSADGARLSVKSEGNFVIAAKGKLVATVGVRNLAIIDTGDSLLVCDLASSADVKEVVARLRATKKLSRYA